jgi:hypothetical protein
LPVTTPTVSTTLESELEVNTLIQASKELIDDLEKYGDDPQEVQQERANLHSLLKKKANITHCG